MVLIWFLCLCTWKNRLLCLKLCCFYKTKEETLKFAALMAKCLTNNLWKFHQKILNYSENNEIFVGGCCLAAPGIIGGNQKQQCKRRCITGGGIHALCMYMRSLHIYIVLAADGRRIENFEIRTPAAWFLDFRNETHLHDGRILGADRHTSTGWCGGPVVFYTSII